MNDVPEKPAADVEEADGGPAAAAAPKLREINAALLVSSVHQHELTEQAQHIAAASARLAAIVDSSDDAIISKTLDGTITSWNRSAEKMFGYAEGEAVGRNILLIIPAERHPEEEYVLDRIRRGEKIDHFETERQTKDGRRISVSLTISPIKDGAGRIIGASKIARDISGAVEARQVLERLNARLRDSEEGYRSVVETVKEYAIFRTDPDGRATTWNEGVQRILGFEKDEFIGIDIVPAIFTVEDVESGVAEQELRDAAANGSAGDDRWLRRKDGSRFWASGITTALKDDAGKLLGFSKVFRDLTERKNFERERDAMLVNEQALRMEAEGANRAKDLFLATLSHEIRTPLNAILGWATLMGAEGCSDEDLKEGIEVIERNARAQAQLIEDVLDVSRIVSGNLHLEIGPCDLINVIHAAMNVMRPAASGRGIRLLTELDESAANATCDAHRIQQVVWNLVSNAVKFTPPDGAVRIKLSRERSSARIEVSDTGMGISPDFLPYVFERFRQADGSARRKYGGLGLGLSIVKHLIELHGGTVEARSAGEGKGSTFIVYLPIRVVQASAGPPDAPEGGAPGDSGAPASAPAHPEAVRLDGLRVMVVDDEPDARRLIAKVLEEAGAITTVAAGAIEALDKLAADPVDLLISDVGMPEMDGLDLIRQVRSRGQAPRDLPAVALTAFARKDDQRRALLAGFQVHVPKPVDPRDLLAAVASLAGRTELAG